jgi:hypothetical protein
MTVTVVIVVVVDMVMTVVIVFPGRESGLFVLVLHHRLQLSPRHLFFR